MAAAASEPLLCLPFPSSLAFLAACAQVRTPQGWVRSPGEAPAPPRPAGGPAAMAGACQVAPGCCCECGSDRACPTRRDRAASRSGMLPAPSGRVGRGAPPGRAHRPHHRCSSSSAGSSWRRCATSSHFAAPSGGSRGGERPSPPQATLGRAPGGGLGPITAGKARGARAGAAQRGAGVLFFSYLADSDGGARSDGRCFPATDASSALRGEGCEGFERAERQRQREPRRSSS